MKVLIVGGVAGGASAAARLRRLDETAEIVLLERGEFISFANCGLPYYVGGDIQEQNALTLQTPDSFHARFRVDVRVWSEAVDIDRAAKTVTVKHVRTGETYRESFDKLILSPGARPVVPAIPGADSSKVFTLRNIPDTLKIKQYIDDEMPASAVVVGGGYIGLEMAENLKQAGLDVTVVEMANHVIASLDYDMACDVHQYLQEKGIRLLTQNAVKAIAEENGALRVTLSGGELCTDMVLLSVGVKPESELASRCGLAVNERGAIVVNDCMQTDDANIYAVGDAVQVTHFVTGQKVQIPLAGPANKQGRIAADNVCGLQSRYTGTQGSSVLKLFDMTVAVTGVTEEAAKAQGLSYDKSFTFSASHAGYYPGGHDMSIKTIFEQGTGRILGAQIVGYDGVDKRCDTFAVAIRAGMTAYDLCKLEFCYAPPFGSAKDPVNFAGFVIENLLTGKVKQFHWHDIAALLRDGSVTLLDVRTPGEYAQGHIEGFLNIPVDALRGRLAELDKTKPIYVHCRSGLRSYLACRILAGNGFDCYNLSGGYRLYDAVVNQKVTPDFSCNACGRQGAFAAQAVATQKEPLTPEQIKSVKGMGFLHNRGTRLFSGRIITENGMLTAKQMAVLAQAAERYGNGDLTFTVRLTVELPGIDFDDIEAFRAFVATEGMQTGGTGSRVRPVVACKGTTCVFGLYDTQGLGAQIHKRFYEGYYNVVLPHKFKIGVGGCPNNCVKPDLNDLGIVGQRVPKMNLDACRGCKKCGVSEACPMGAAQVIDGKININPDACNNCGRCVGKCPFKIADEAETMYKIHIGGRWGKKVRMGSALTKLFTREQALDVIEKAILLFKSEGISGERFGDTVDRLGVEVVEKKLVSDELLNQKQDILQIETIGGAKC